MNNLSKISLFLFLIFSIYGGTFATYYENSVASNFNTNTEISTKTDIISTSDVFIFEKMFVELTSYLQVKDILNYSKINLNITGPLEGSDFYKSVQKVVSVGALPNSNFELNGNRKMTAYSFYSLAEKIYDINLIQSSQIKGLKSRIVDNNDLLSLRKILSPNDVVSSVNKKSNAEAANLLVQKKKIFNDVQETLINSHFDKDVFDEIKLIEAATIGLTKGTGDKFTTYFPPTENKSFMDSLDGTFEGIGSYVEMQEPGVLNIVTPISGSPSEKAGLKGGDQVTYADGKKILPTTSIEEAISWIKGPKGTVVILTIKRGRQILKISVIRDTIIIENIEHKKINSNTYYIKVVSFGNNVSNDFKSALVELKKNTSTKKLIIDLRNNPGGYLAEVSDILSHFVPVGDETVVVKYLAGDRNYYSKGYNLIDPSKYRIIVLQNSGSASASEIMAGTIKDYLPSTTIIGEQSYGKGSVQTIKPYSDGSSLKYTIAKWFTGKSITGIDGVGIPVDIELEFDFDSYQENKIDNQLEKAKIIR